jgi:hypothetical protein
LADGKYYLFQISQDNLAGTIFMNKFLLLTIALSLISCQPTGDNHMTNVHEPIKLTFEQANFLSQLPLHCITVEYPNKLGQVLGNDEDLKPPRELRPAFYGCFDWHSAVHGHWSLVVLLKEFPDLNHRDEIIRHLESHITPENIAAEVAFFEDENNRTFQRTYGWGWLLKLAEALHTWDHPAARRLEQNLQPLTDLIADRFIEFLPDLYYPIRVGEHTNSAFGLSMAYDYAVTVKHDELKSVIEQRARDHYMSDEGCPITWEPSGYDFLSPCLEEALLMSKLLEENEYRQWLSKFLPQLNDEDFYIAPGVVTDRADGKLVHLDGLNFSRAWCLYGIADILPEYGHLRRIANEHIQYSLPNLVDDTYEGSHWLGTFAINALIK